MRQLKNRSNILLTMVLILGVFSFLGSAEAMEWYLGSDTKFLLDAVISYGAGVRVSDRDEELLTDINTDDGNRNFDQWDFTNNKATLLADIEFIYKNVGVFVRPKAFYDYVYMTDNANDRPDTNNAYIGGLIDESDQWADEIEDVHGMNAEILDAFAYASFQLGEVPFDIRAGRQVINWGEGTYISSIGNVTSPIDASAATAVGTEVKEIWLPTGAVYVQTGYGDLGLCVYYQWEWEKTRLMEGGTFYSSADYLDELKAPLLTELAPGMVIDIPRLDDQEAKDDGQYGVSLSYMLPWGATQIAGYYVNYHDKLLSTLEAGLNGYYLTYAEDLTLYGLTVSSAIGDAQVFAEFSYRDDITFQSRENGVEEGDFFQSVAGFTYLKSPGWFGLADRIILSGEGSYGTQIDLIDDDEGFKYVAVINFDWFQVLQRTDFGFNISYGDSPAGDPSLSSMEFTEDKAALSVGIDFVFNYALKGSLTYENRMQDNSLRDRDTLSLELSYSF